MLVAAVGDYPRLALEVERVATTRWLQRWVSLERPPIPHTEGAFARVCPSPMRRRDLVSEPRYVEPYAPDVTERKRIEDEARFPSEAGKILVTAASGYQSMLTGVAKRLIGNLADWCSIDVAQAGQLRRVKLIHRDPTKAAICDAHERYPVHRRQNLVSKVVQNQCRFLMSEVTPEYLESLAQDAEHLHANLERAARRSTSPCRPCAPSPRSDTTVFSQGLQARALPAGGICYLTETSGRAK